MLSTYTELLRIRHFRNLWLGQTISRIGDAFYFVGPMFVVKKLFNDDAMVGYVLALESLPYLLLGPVAGAIADRFDRKKIMMWADLMAALVLFAFLAYLFAIDGNPPRWPFYLFGPLLTTSRVFFFPAKNAVVPRVLPQEKLLEGNAMNASTDQIMWLVGNLLTAGFASLVNKYGPKQFLEVMVLVNAITFLWSVVYIYMLPSILPEREEVHEQDMLIDIREGIKYAKTDKVIGLSLLATVGLSFFMSPFFVVYMATNQAWFGERAERLAIIEACFIVGMLFMSFYIPKLNIKKAGIAFGGGMAVAGSMVVLMGFSQNFYVYCLWNLVCGFAIGIVNVPMMTYQQLKVPDEYRGRIGSLGNLIWMGVQPIGAASGGALLSFFGIVWMHILMGLGFATTGSAPLLSKEFRDAEIPEVSDADEHGTGEIPAVALGPTLEPMHFESHLDQDMESKEKA
jgi:MFS transporter, DHA3 family, macrolide efflux protein